MPAAVALPVMLLAFWDAWRLLAGRFGDGMSALPLIAMMVGVLVVALRRRAGGTPRVPAAQPVAAFALYAAATAFAPALVQIVVAVTAVLSAGYAASKTRTPLPPLIALGLLVLPVMPSLDFYLAYPMRVVCAGLTAGLLRLGGLAVGVEGVALRWNGSLILFDAACSGVRMLWANLFLVSVVALAAGFSAVRYARAIGIAVAMTIAGNALRAASLFYVENGFVAPLSGPIAHEAVGIVAFLVLAALTAVMVAPRHWRLA